MKLRVYPLIAFDAMLAFETKPTIAAKKLVIVGRACFRRKGSKRY